MVQEEYARAMDIETLQQRLKRGDSEAFQEFVTHYQQRVTNSCYGFAHNREDAEDIAQEVFIEVYRSIEKFREVEQLPAPATETPEKIVEQQERSRVLKQAVDSLSENQRIAITLHKYEGFSSKEIADRLLGTIWTLLLKKPPETASDAQSFMEQELRLTEPQAAQFENLRVPHLVGSKQLLDDIHEVKQAITAELFAATPDIENVNELAAQIGDKYAELEQLRFQYFLERGRQPNQPGEDQPPRPGSPSKPRPAS